MKTAIRKTACAALAGAVFFSMTGCSMANSLLGKTDVTTPDSTGDLELNFYRNEEHPDSWNGNYTITLIDPRGRTLWEGYVEVA